MKKYKILAVTLARGGSRSIKKKNLALINGKPLIYYTIKEALKSKLISRYIVSTDDPQTKKISKKYGAEVPFLRPKKYSTSKAKAVVADMHALKWVEKNESCKYDFFIELMATNPLKTHKDIDNVLRKLIRSKADSVIGMVKAEDHHPLRIKKIVNGKIKNFSKDLIEIPEMHRQQLKPSAYIRNGSMYASKRNMLIKGKRYGTKNSIAYLMNSNNSINIDTPIDLMIAKEILKKRNIKK
jgi:CMP-N-acetylneuraminic acid synthetase